MTPLVSLRFRGVLGLRLLGVRDVMRVAVRGERLRFPTSRNVLG